MKHLALILFLALSFQMVNAQKIYKVSYGSQADLKIYIVNYESQAGWRNTSKRHLLDF